MVKQQVIDRAFEEARRLQAEHSEAVVTYLECPRWRVFRRWRLHRHARQLHGLATDAFDRCNMLCSDAIRLDDAAFWSRWGGIVDKQPVGPPASQ